MDERKEGDKSAGIRNGLTPPLGGVWLHRQTEDEIVDYGDLGQLGMDEDEDDDDDRTTFSEDSVPSTPLPQLHDVSIFDPCAAGMFSSMTIDHRYRKGDSGRKCNPFFAPKWPTTAISFQYLWM